MVLSGQKEVLPDIKTLSELFQISVLAKPNSRALADAADGSAYTFQELNKITNQLARCISTKLKLIKNQNPDNDLVVAVCIAPSASLVITLLAIHKAGAAYLPLDVTFPSSRVSHILEDSKPSVLIKKGRPNALQDITQEKYHLSILDYDNIALAEHCDSNLTASEIGLDLNLDCIGAVLYTSGSTGTPKGVRIPQRAFLNRLSWQWKTFPYSADEVCVFKTALTFVDSISEIFGPLLTGHTVIAVPKCMTQAVEGLIKVLSNEGVERLVLVPSLLRSILLHCSSPGADKLPKLRLWVCSGEVFPPDLLTSFFKTFTNQQRICNFYGSTEIMGDVTYITFDSEEDIETKLIENKVPIGAPIQNVSLHLLDKDENPVEDGNVGELYVSGLNNCSGYVGNAQPQKFIHNKWNSAEDGDKLFRTGDYAKIVNGYLLYEGRADSQVKIRGHRVDLAEVQAALQSVDKVDKCVVLCYKPGNVDQALIAYYTSEDEELVPEVIKVLVAEKLPPYMQPQLFKLDDLPLLVNGKIDRQSLLKTYENRTSGGIENKLINISAAKDADKEAAEDLLKTALRVLGPAAPDEISLEQSFFEVGGNSLNAILTLTSLKDLGYDIGISDFLEAKVFKDLLPYMKKVQNDPFNFKTISSNEKAKEEFPYVSEMLQISHQEKAVNLIAKSFAGKGDLEQWLHTEEWEYHSFLSQMWKELVAQNLSFLVLRKDSKKLVGVSLNMDLYKEPPVDEVSPKIAYIFDFLEDVEAPVRERLPTGEGKVIHSFMMGTDESISMAENVSIIQFMEHENIRLGKAKNFSAMFTTNTSALTQAVCDDLLGYTVFADNQVNIWRASDGSKPFGEAPDSQRAVVTAKLI